MIDRCASGVCGAGIGVGVGIGDLELWNWNWGVGIGVGRLELGNWNSSWNWNCFGDVTFRSRVRGPSGWKLGAESAWILGNWTLSDILLRFWSLWIWNWSWDWNGGSITGEVELGNWNWGTGVGVGKLELEVGNWNSGELDTVLWDVDVPLSGSWLLRFDRDVLLRRCAFWLFF